MRTVGLVVNPIAGMGGRVGLKGTDGKAAAARDRGADPRAHDRAREAVEGLLAADPDVTVVAAAGIVGETAAREAGADPTVVEVPGADVDVDPTDPDAVVGATDAADTRAAVRSLIDHGVDVILFVGGDGTAGDVAEALSAADADVPMLGVPAGVKVYSAVFGVSPRAAGHVTATFDRTESAEINDVDEDDYRDGEVRTELRALATVPVADQRQASKQLGGGSVEGLAAGVAEDVESGVTYVFGPGGTVGAVEEALGIDGTPLGVDVYRDGEVLARDAGEAEILAALGDRNVIVVSPIGGQGFVLGRGNQQLSPAVIRQSELWILASRRKLDETGVLRADTGDPDLDESLQGWQRVRVGRHEHRLVEVV